MNQRQPGDDGNEHKYLAVADYERRIDAAREGKSGRFKILSRDMRNSPAYRDLTLAAREVLHCYLDKLYYEKHNPGSRRQKHSTSPVNGGHLIVTNNEIRAYGGVTADGTMKRARQELVQMGFLDYVQFGSAQHGADIMALSDRWRQYPDGEYQTDKLKPAGFGQRSNIADNLKRQGRGRRSRQNSPFSDLSGEECVDDQSP